MPSLAKSKAWKMLREEEKLALDLKLVQKKSSWEAGEIMNKSHYKYLEIVARAEYFLKRFTEHFNKYGDLVPEDVELNPGFKEYLELVMPKRCTQKEAFKKLIHYRFSYDSQFRTEFIATEIKRLAQSKKLIEKYFYNLIMDFDRWNNFRILPTILQEPHAFKRRQKNRLKKFLMNSCKLGDKVSKHISKELRYVGDPKKTMWAYVIKNIYTQEYKVVPIKRNERNVEVLSKYGIFLYDKEKHCREMLDAITGYFRVSEGSNVIKGQTFWPVYRDLIKVAINGNLVENILPNRKEYIITTGNAKAERTKLQKIRNNSH